MRIRGGGTGDRDGDPAVSPSWPRPPHPPCRTAGLGVMGKAARSGDTARAIQRPSPPAAATATAAGTGTSHPKTPGKRRCHRGHRVPSTYPMQECLRDGHRLPGSIVPLRRPRWLWRGRPRRVAAAVPAGTASCHPAAPCFPASASHPRWYRPHKAALSLRRPRGVMPASVPGPVPPPLTPLPPQGTAPGGDESPRRGVGAQLTPLVSALMTSERCPWRRRGGRGRYK